MAIVVEDGSGKSDADSYISVADADTYHAAHSGSAVWSGASTAEKEKALRLATQYLDALYGRRWKGARWTVNQALYWPRDSVEFDGQILDATSLPQQLLDATCEAAYKQLVDGDTLFDDMADEGTVLSATVRVGPITDSKTYAGGSTGLKRYRLIESLISVLVEPTNQLSRA